jgi:hypothetical protein
VSGAVEHGGFRGGLFVQAAFRKRWMVRDVGHSSAKEPVLFKFEKYLKNA